MNEADQRAKDAEGKAIAAVTAISMVKIPEQKKIKLNNRGRRKVLALDVHGRQRGQEELREVLGRGRDVLECSGTRLFGETAAGMGCHLPRPDDRERMETSSTGT